MCSALGLYAATLNNLRLFFVGILSKKVDAFWCCSMCRICDIIPANQPLDPMPIEFTLNASDNCIFADHMGCIDAQNLRTAYGGLLKDVADWTNVIEVAHLGQTSSLNISPPEMRELANLLTSQRDQFAIRWTKLIIAPNDSDFALSRIYVAHAGFIGATHYHVARNFDEAAQIVDFPLYWFIEQAHLRTRPRSA